MGKYNKALYPLLILVIGILVLYYVANTTEGFYNSGPLIASTGIPNAQVVPIYFLLKNTTTNAAPTYVVSSTPNSAIKKIELNGNMAKVTLSSAHAVQDFTSYGFSGSTWQIGKVDEGLTTTTLLDSANKAINRRTKKTALKKLPQTLTTFTIGPITKGGFPTLNMNGDPAKDGGKVSGPANIRIDLLLSK